MCCVGEVGSSYFLVASLKETLNLHEISLTPFQTVSKSDLRSRRRAEERGPRKGKDGTTLWEAARDTGHQPSAHFAQGLQKSTAKPGLMQCLCGLIFFTGNPNK